MWTAGRPATENVSDWYTLTATWKPIEPAHETEPDDIASAALPVRLGETMRGMLGRVDDVDYYYVRGEGGGTLVGEVTGVPGADLRVVVLPAGSTMGPPGPLPPGAKVFDAGGVGAGEKLDGVDLERRHARAAGGDRAEAAAAVRAGHAPRNGRARQRIRAFAAPKALRSCYDVATAGALRPAQGGDARARTRVAARHHRSWRSAARTRRRTRRERRRRRARARVKLAVLPVDSDAYPQIAASLNNALHDVKVKGVDDYFLSKVALEVVQLSIECVQPTSELLRCGRQVAVGERAAARDTSRRWASRSATGRCA